MNTILGIDQSFNGCAYVVIQNDIMIDFGIIRSSKEDNIFTRALKMALTICDIYKKFTPDIVQLEGLAYGMMGNATRDLAGLLFTIVNVLTINFPDIKYVLLSPKSVKKFATGSGKATKTDMITSLPEEIRSQFAAKNFKKTTGMADLSDAYYISTYK